MRIIEEHHGHNRVASFTVRPSLISRHAVRTKRPPSVRECSDMSQERAPQIVRTAMKSESQPSSNAAPPKGVMTAIGGRRLEPGGTDAREEDDPGDDSHPATAGHGSAGTSTSGCYPNQPLTGGKRSVHAKTTANSVSARHSW